LRPVTRFLPPPQYRGDGNWPHAVAHRYSAGLYLRYLAALGHNLAPIEQHIAHCEGDYTSEACAGDGDASQASAPGEVAERADPEGRTCILTGTPGEDPGDHDTQAHEYEPATQAEPGYDGAPAAGPADRTPADTGAGLPRAECPECHGDVALRKGGELREHPDHRHDLYSVPGAVRDGKVPGCPWSGRKPGDHLSTQADSGEAASGDDGSTGPASGELTPDASDSPADPVDVGDGEPERDDRAADAHQDEAETDAAETAEAD
jgi:hypothetical protein